MNLSIRQLKLPSKYITVISSLTKYGLMSRGNGIYMKNSFVLILEIKINLPLSFSLKEKRRVKRSITDRLRKGYNVSVAETGSQDNLKFLELSLAYVSISMNNAEDMREKLVSEIKDIIEEYRGELNVEDFIV